MLALEEKNRTIATVPCTDILLKQVALDMRVEDAAEVLRATNLTPLEGLRFCVTHSRISRIVKIGDDVIGAYGLVQWSLASGRGSPWALTTHSVYRHRRDFARLSKVILGQLRDLCPNGLEVMIDEDYPVAVRWAKWLGFVVDGPHAWGQGRHPFMRAAIGPLEVN